MKTSRFSLAIAATLSAAATMAATFAQGQEFPAEPATPPAASAEESWYRSAPSSADKMTIARQKSMAKGQQRMSRLESMRWYGFYGGRPTAAAIPYTTMYSPAWQQPGGRPFAWHTSSRPVIIYGSAATLR